ADRDRKFRRCGACTGSHPAIGRSLGAGARRGGVGVEPAHVTQTLCGIGKRSSPTRERAVGGSGMDGGARADSGLMTTLVCLGLGYCARHYVSEFGARFHRVVGTARNADRAAALARDRLGGRPVEILPFDGTSSSRELRAAILAADALLVSAAPADGRDPVLAVLEPDIAQAPRLKSVVYLSSLGVYGDSGGAWIDETTPPIPALARRGEPRIKAELDWQALGSRRRLP